MRYKLDWPAAASRLSAMWEGRHAGRPCIAVTAPQASAVPWPAPPASYEARWLDAEWVVAELRAALAAAYWGGEAIPSYLLMAGWVLGYGATPQFEAHTIWHTPITVDYATPPNFAFDQTDPWVQRYATLFTGVAAEAGADGFHVGQPLLLPGNDLLAAILGTEEMLCACAEYPEWVHAAILQIARGQVAALRHFAAITQAYGNTHWYGSAGWMPFWAPEPVLCTQSDVSCMLSPAMYEQFVLPELELYGREIGALWYHLDGGDARQHLPRLCSLPYLRVIQYTPTPSEPPNGPEHLDFYRAIQAAGKIVHIDVPIEHVEPLVRALDPSLLYLLTSAASPADAEALLVAAEGWV